jgi:hypothetical protein
MTASGAGGSVQGDVPTEEQLSFYECFNLTVQPDLTRTRAEAVMKHLLDRAEIQARWDTFRAESEVKIPPPPFPAPLAAELQAAPPPPFIPVATQAATRPFSRRSLLIVASITVVVLLGLYVVLGPFVTLYQVSGALATGDSDALEDHVDFERVREGMKAKLNIAMQEQLKSTSDQNNPFSQLGAMLGGVMVSKVLDMYCTPSGVTAFFKKAMENNGTAADSDHIVWKGTTHYWFDSPGRFNLRLVMPDPDKGYIDVVLRRSGLTWRIVALELPFDQMMKDGEQGQQNQQTSNSGSSMQLAGGSPTDSPRALTAPESSSVIQMICNGPATAPDPQMHYAYHCAEFNGLSKDEVNLMGGDGADISLKAIAYGPITRAEADQMYVSYDSSFEPHASNYGGGVLFDRTPRGWHLTNWYHGGQIADCMAVPVTGKRTFLCLNHWAGQGEADSSIAVTQISESADEESMAKLNQSLVSALDARDEDEQSQDPQSQEVKDPYQCTLARAATDAVPFSIDNLHVVSGPGYFAEASVDYAEPAEMARGCQAHSLAGLKLTSGKLHFALRNDIVVYDSPAPLAQSR